MIEQHSVQSLLQWYLDAGHDETIGDEPINRFLVPAQMRAPVSVAAAPMPPSPPSRPALAVAQAPQHHTTAHMAAQCRTLDELRRCMEQFDDLPLKQTARSTVFADGNPKADLMIIGEAPGQDEDRLGVPFVGKSGKLLDRMLASIGFDRETAYITNVVPWRPLENRKPSHDEIAACLPFISRHIELVDPKCLLLLGGAAASAILASESGISRLRGQWFEYSSLHLPRPVPVLASYHPAYLLRTPAAKRHAWRDFLLLKRRMIALTAP